MPTNNIEITRWGHAIVPGDTHFSKWIKETGKMDHGQDIEQTFRKYFGEGDTVIDIGACLGDHTVPYAQIVGPSGKVYAFEPNPSAYACLTHNVQCYPWVETFNMGLGRKFQLMNIRSHENLGASFLDPVPYLDSDGETPVIPVGVLDELLGDTHSPIKFIKIDVEGFEIEVLEGARKTLERHRPVMVIECAMHQERYGHTQAELFEWLRGNLRDYDLKPEAHTDEPQYDIVAWPR